ncbi:hypothetical protein BC834DRAFT_29925 [Gloeopeniophorella convolvens]|nr:hypothetical protein BC834DRAFT_29925 [Gloeopeniophorella convolvens]
MSAATASATPSDVLGSAGSFGQGNLSTIASPASNVTLPFCSPSVNGTNTTSLASPGSVSFPLTNTSLPVATAGQNVTNTTSVSNSTATATGSCIPLPVTPTNVSSTNVTSTGSDSLSSTSSTTSLATSQSSTASSESSSASTSASKSVAGAPSLPEGSSGTTASSGSKSSSTSGPSASEGSPPPVQSSSSVASTSKSSSAPPLPPPSSASQPLKPHSPPSSGSSSSAASGTPPSAPSSHSTGSSSSTTSTVKAASPPSSPTKSSTAVEVTPPPTSSPSTKTPTTAKDTPTTAKETPTTAKGNPPPSSSPSTDPPAGPSTPSAPGSSSPKPPSTPSSSSSPNLPSTPSGFSNPNLPSTPSDSNNPTSPSSPSLGGPSSPDSAPTGPAKGGSTPKGSSTGLPPVSTSFSAPGSATKSGAAGRLQSTASTITSTITDTPESTFSTPHSITETSDGHVTVTAPPFITSIGLSTMPDGTVVSVTHVFANPTNTSSAGHSFFGNHAAVIGVFLVTGIVVACIAAFTFCFCRRRRRRGQIRGERLPEPTLPQVQNPFADSAENPAMLEHTRPNIRWNRFASARDQVDPTRSLVSVRRDRSQISLPSNPSTASIPLPPPPPPAQRASSRSSHRVPVPFAGVGAHGGHARTTSDPDYSAPFSDYHQMQPLRVVPPAGLPPPPPLRSPLRLLASQNRPMMPQENARNQSRASTPSIYPPSLHRAESRTDSLYEKEIVASSPPSPPKREPLGWLRRGLALSSRPAPESKQDNGSPQSTHASPIDSDGARSWTPSGGSSSSHARYSPLESPASETGTALTSILDEKIYRTFPLALPEPAVTLKHPLDVDRMPARVERGVYRAAAPGA